MAQARIDEFVVVVRYYETDYSPTEVREAVEAAVTRITTDLDEGDGALAQVKPKEGA